MATHKHSGDCGRCGLPTGSLTAAFCAGCRLVAVRAANHARKGLPCPKPKRGGKGAYRPVLGRMLPQALAGMPSDSWWTHVAPGQMTAAARVESLRMRMSKEGKRGGGPVFEVWG